MRTMHLQAICVMRTVLTGEDRLLMDRKRVLPRWSRKSLLHIRRKSLKDEACNLISDKKFLMLQRAPHFAEEDNLFDDENILDWHQDLWWTTVLEPGWICNGESLSLFIRQSLCQITSQCPPYQESLWDYWERVDLLLREWVILMYALAWPAPRLRSCCSWCMTCSLPGIYFPLQRI